MAAVVLAATLGAMWAQLTEKPIYTEYDVRFLEPIHDAGGYAWWVETANGRKRIDFCNDYDVSKLTPQPGEVLWKFRYRDMGGCDSIRDDGLGIWFYRDARRWTVETDIHRNFNQVLKEIKDAERTR